MRRFRFGRSRFGRSFDERPLAEVPEASLSSDLSLSGISTSVSVCSASLSGLVRFPARLLSRFECGGLAALLRAPVGLPLGRPSQCAAERLSEKFVCSLGVAAIDASVSGECADLRVDGVNGDEVSTWNPAPTRHKRAAIMPSSSHHEQKRKIQF